LKHEAKVAEGERPEGEITWVPIAETEAHPDNPREDLKRDLAVAAMAKDLKSRGAFPVEFPLVGRRVESGKVQIGDGHIRLAAAVRAGLTELPVIVKVLSDDEMLVLMVKSNERTPFTPLAEGRLIIAAKKLAEREGGKMTLRHYAETRGKSLPVVRDLYQAAKIADIVLKKTGGVPIRRHGDSEPTDLNSIHRQLSKIHAAKNARLKKRASADDIVELVKQVISRKMSPDQTATLVDEYNESHEPEPDQKKPDEKKPEDKPTGGAAGGAGGNNGADGTDKDGDGEDGDEPEGDAGGADGASNGTAGSSTTTDTPAAGTPQPQPPTPRPPAPLPPIPDDDDAEGLARFQAQWFPQLPDLALS